MNTVPFPIQNTLTSTTQLISELFMSVYPLQPITLDESSLKQSQGLTTFFRGQLQCQHPSPNDWQYPIAMVIRQCGHLTNYLVVTVVEGGL